ncbi:hypothetical protein SLEP1_g59691 [Rubroshorea leprosula]|uniref:Uncharacterized protein n=1 Tax=Rubroshorea leprosula TaxID=152421 RepID=A0AAV5MT39_9ROSI|nr:hypothetical protein SLEP1_g59691 [Rubroshorea leprosula]
MESPKVLNQPATPILIFFLTSLMFSATDSKPYDYLQYVVQWQPAVCRIPYWPYTRCNKPIKQVFTIHGLWPSNFSGADVNCRNGTGYDRNEVISIEQKLKKCWPDMLHDDDHIFWSHEWKSHGRCFPNVFRGQSQYFNKAVGLCYGYNTWIKSTLADYGIYPSNSRPVSRDRIAASIHGAIGKRPVLRCAGPYFPDFKSDPGLGYPPSPSSGYQTYVSRKSHQKRKLEVTFENRILLEVILCFDVKGGDLIDCPRQTNCRSEIYFLA